jgi:predicted nucleic acid-binding protein
MTVVLDSGGLSALAGDFLRLRRLRDKVGWPAVIPTAVLVASLTRDPRRDFHTNRLLRHCLITPLDEATARRAAALRGAVRRKGVSAVDAIVVATAETLEQAMILTSDPLDLGALAAWAEGEIEVRKV